LWRFLVVEAIFDFGKQEKGKGKREKGKGERAKDRLLREVEKRGRGKGERFGIFPFPFNMYRFSL
jgi:hypothetical protein